MMQIQEWYEQNTPDEKMLWKDSTANQVKFFRDEMAYAALGPDPDDYYKGTHGMGPLARVVSTHTSKSIKLPVVLYQSPHPDRKCKKLNFYMRDNFHDMRITVLSDLPIYLDFGGTFSAESCGWAEGFKEDWVKGPFYQGAMEFSVVLGGHNQALTFVRLVREAYNREAAIRRGVPYLVSPRGSVGVKLRFFHTDIKFKPNEHELYAAFRKYKFDGQEHDGSYNVIDFTDALPPEPEWFGVLNTVMDRIRKAEAISRLGDTGGTFSVLGLSPEMQKNLSDQGLTELVTNDKQ